MFDEKAKQKARVIVSIFETGEALGKPDAVAVLSDGAGISYGIHQATHKSGALHNVVNCFCAIASETEEAQKLMPYLSNLKNAHKVYECSRDEKLKALLRKAGQHPKMLEAQHAIFDRDYMNPAIKVCEGSNFVLPLSLAVIYDSKIQGSYERIRDLVPAGLDERAWIKRYVKKRNEWLMSRQNPTVRNSAYRTRELLKLIEAENWELSTPFVVRGITVTDELLK